MEMVFLGFVWGMVEIPLKPYLRVLLDDELATKLGQAGGRSAGFNLLTFR